jgi:hypothetical protein
MSFKQMGIKVVGYTPEGWLKRKEEIKKREEFCRLRRISREHERVLKKQREYKSIERNRQRIFDLIEEDEKSPGKLHVRLRNRK